MIRIKFKRKFVMFCTHTFRDEEDGMLKTVEKQYHIEPSKESFAVEDAQAASQNTISVRFPSLGGPYQGTAVVGKDDIEILKDVGSPVNFGKSGCC